MWIDDQSHGHFRVSIGVFCLAATPNFTVGEVLLSPILDLILWVKQILALGTQIGRKPNKPTSTLHSPGQWTWSLGLPKPWLSQSNQSELQDFLREIRAKMPMLLCWVNQAANHCRRCQQSYCNNKQSLVRCSQQIHSKERHENVLSLGAFSSCWVMPRWH